MSAEDWVAQLYALDDATLRRHVCSQPWFRSPAGGLSEIRIIGCQILAGDLEAGGLVSALAEARDRWGNSDLYQLLLLTGRHDNQSADRHPESLVTELAGGIVCDALMDPEACRRLIALVLDLPLHELTDSQVEHIGSNRASSSVRVGAQVLKVYRELQPGPNVELEWLEALKRTRFEHVPALLGSLSSDGVHINATLAIVQEHVDDAVSATDHLAVLAHDPDAMAIAARQLGQVVAALHEVALSAHAEVMRADPSTPEHAALLMAEIDDEIDQTLQGMDAAGTLASELRRHVVVARDLAQRLAGAGGLGDFVRNHGDLRMRHVLHTGRGWMLVGFQGDVSQAISDRRLKRPGLWDVACARRSILRLGEDLGGDPARWHRAAAAFTRSYRQAVATRLLPVRGDLGDGLLELFEMARLVQLIGSSSTAPEDQQHWTQNLHQMLTRAGLGS